jgi:hypothetical protein
MRLTEEQIQFAAQRAVDDRATKLERQVAVSILRQAALDERHAADIWREHLELMRAEYGDVDEQAERCFELILGGAEK